MRNRVSTGFARHALAREPTVHFVMGALLLFGVRAVVRSHGEDVIEIDSVRIEARIAQVESQSGRALNTEERALVREGYIDEQVLAREARATGLDDDPQVAGLLANKMLDVLSADVLQPSADELVAYYHQNQSRYAEAATVDADEVIVGTFGDLPESLQAQLRARRPADSLATSLPLERGELRGVSRNELERIVGPDIGGRVFEATVGDWVGPRRSVRGQHWFRVTGRATPQPPPIEAIRESVRLDWVADQEQLRLRVRVAELRARYSIQVSGPEAP